MTVIRPTKPLFLMAFFDVTTGTASGRQSGEPAERVCAHRGKVSPHL